MTSCWMACVASISSPSESGSGPGSLLKACVGVSSSLSTSSFPPAPEKACVASISSSPSLSPSSCSALKAWVGSRSPSSPDLGEAGDLLLELLLLLEPPLRGDAAISWSDIPPSFTAI